MKRNKTKILKNCLLTGLLFFSLTAHAQWDFNMGDTLYTPYPNSPFAVYDMCVGNDTLYVSGEFNLSDTIEVNGIAKRSGPHWLNLNNGNASDDGLCVEFYHNKLYLSGGFPYLDWDHQNTVHFAVWDGNSWTGPPGGYPIGTCFDFLKYNDTLFIAREASHGVFAFNGTDFLDMGNIGNNWTRSVEAFNGELYAGGYHGLWKYKGNFQWQYLSDGPQGHVYDMCIDTINNFLYCGGAFDYVGDTLISSCVTMWDGFRWHSMGYALSCDVYWYHPMAIYRGSLYVGWCGDTMHTGLVSRGFTRWDGHQWHAIEGGSIDVGGVYCLQVFQDTLWVGGMFDSIAGQRIRSLAKYYLPDTGCNFLQPLVQSYADTFYLPQSGGTVDVPLYNNNGYADSWSWDFDDGTTDTVKDPIHTYSQTGTYHVSVTVTEDGCTKTAEKDIVVMESTGIPALSLQDITFKIYPNPTKHDFTVEIMLPETVKEKTKFFVTGMNGVVKYQRQLQAGFNRFVVGTGGWHPATYICNLMAGGKFLGSKKLVLNK